MKLLFSIFLVTLSLICFSQPKEGKLIGNSYYQNHTPENPKAGALGSFGNIPVNYYIGQPEVSLPLTSVSSRELSIPISINYDASGIRTDDMGGMVGFKWQLNAGGQVVRALTGMPDETPSNGYLVFASSTDYYRNAMHPDWVNWISDASRDSGPDEFIVMINGRSIKFVFDKYGNAMTIPRQNVKISKTIVSGKITQFEVIDENGVKYIFGGTTESIEERKIESFNMTISLFWDWYEDPIAGPTWPLHKGPSGEGVSHSFDTSEKIKPAYNSKWYLKQVISSSGDHIDLNYEKLTDIKYITKPTAIRIKSRQVEIIAPTVCCPTATNKTIYANQKFGDDEPGGDGDDNAPILHFSPYRNEKMVTPGGIFVNQSLITESSIRLTSIAAANGAHVNFESSLRDDLPNGYKYDKLIVYNHENVKVNDVRLNYATINANETNEYLWVSEAILLTKVNFTQTGDIYAPFGKAFTEAEVDHTLFRKYVLQGLKEYNYKRVFLESIDEAAGNVKQNKYSFTYNGREQLRRRTTPLLTYLGFSRDSRSNPERDITIKADTYAKTTNSLEPENNAQTPGFPARGMLSKIKFPTQGSTEFSYSVDNGPKLTLITDRDENGTVVNQKEIDYDYNEIASILWPRLNSSYVTKSYQEFKMNDNTGYLKNMITSTSPQNEPVLTKGAISGNMQVKVYQGTVAANLGWEVFTFTPPAVLSQSLGVFVYDSLGNPFTHFQDQPSLAYATPEDVNTVGVTIDSFNDADVFPFVKSENRDHLRGLLVKHTVHDKTGVTVKSTINNYTINPHNYVPHRVYGMSGGKYVYTSDDQTSFWEGHYTSPQHRFRYGRYKLKSDWVVLTKTTETIYDQANTSKSVAMTKSFVYDPINLQLVKVISSQSNDPGTKVINETKYATHNDYIFPKSCETTFNSCLSGCPTDDLNCRTQCETQLNNCVNLTGTSKVDAIVKMRQAHQIAVPIEQQTWLESQGATRLISATVSKFTPVGAVTKPSEVWSLSKPLSASNYTSSSALANGSFNFDSTDLRLVHKFDSYHTDGTLTQQTSLDGSVSSYLWDGTHSLVNMHTSNPSSQQQQSTYAHKPLVGLTSVTDPNGISSSFEYDLHNRLKLTKDYAGQIVNRYRYHYLNDVDNKVDFTYSPQSLNAVQFAVSSVNESSSNYTWDFGAGTVRENVSGAQNFAYTTPGTYMVTLLATHPEYPTSSVRKSITILSPGNIQITAPNTGSTRTINPCNPNENLNTTMVATATGAGPFNYQWEYFPSNATPPYNWLLVGQNSPTLNFNHTLGSGGSNAIRCRVSDSNGNSVYLNSITIFYYCPPPVGGPENPPGCPPGCTQLSNGNCDCGNVGCGGEGSGCYYDSGGNCICP